MGTWFQGEVVKLESILIWFPSICLITCLLIPLVPSFFFIEGGADSSDTYECGIDPFCTYQNPVYMHFFLVGVLFLVFDVEIVVSIPLVYNPSLPGSWGVVWLTLASILFLGLLLEVTLGTLDWKE